jgi:Cdc6-like AAA superfamily ATPase
MKKEELIRDLSNVAEMNPDEHDGSYELMREIVASYKAMGDLSACNFRDLNAVYMMAVGTWKSNPEKKKEYIFQTHLPESEKNRMVQVIDRIWDNACHSKYQNRVNNKPSIGMFGTGFYSFQNKTTDLCSKTFIQMLVDISDMSDDAQMFDRAALVLNADFRGMKSASASVVLHCLKPNSFPILNANMGNGNIFGVLGVNLNHPSDIDTYIDNCRRIKQFRDDQFSFKNYRILDQWAKKIDKYQDDAYFPTLDEYDPGITSEQYESMFSEAGFVEKSNLDTLYYLYKIGGEGSCTQLAVKFGNHPQHYNSNANHLAKKVAEKTSCQLFNGEKNDDKDYWTIFFQGRHSKKTDEGTFIWHMRQPLMDAIEVLEESGFFEELVMDSKDSFEFDHNIILYGPPGTGKTYNTVIYAVAIIEEKSLKEIEDEAKTNYEAVKARYESYKDSKLIGFTTFHQSYGYEEFIEGIRPELDDSDLEGQGAENANGDISYRRYSGVFKAFCENAMKTVSKGQEEDYGLNMHPAVWKISLKGAGDNEVKRECFENNHIRIGWDEYGPEINESIINEYGGGAILDTFKNKMQIGDLVLSLYSKSEIDAIGVITGEYEWVEGYKYYSRVRKVKWLAKGIRENVLSINNGSNLTLSTVYRLKMQVEDVLEIVRRNSPQKTEEKPKNHVFIIDEINRGNISKIFGELITLIEWTKRLGNKEAATAKLPYSGVDFGVPSNVYILGTMNTADRSIAIMDTALRRRFSFIEMMPDVDVLRNIGADKVIANGQTLDVAEMLKVINDRIAFLYDREHTIGHAFFTGLADDHSIEKLASIFEKSVIPLLQEYFYEDYSKIQLVLGDDGKRNEEDKQYQFIRDTEIKPEDIFNTVPEFEQQGTDYVIQYSAFHKIESYKKMGKNL